MQKSKRPFMDVLGDSDGDDSDGSNSDGEEPAKKVSKVAQPKPKPKAASVQLADLEKAGYQGGPSVLHMPAQAREEPEQAWGWSDGTAAKAKETAETMQERQATRDAVTKTVEENAMYAMAMVSYADKLRAEKKAEKEAKAKQKSLSFKEKEKKKRDAGQQAAGKNYVEEEKRIAREAGVYSGFDT